MTASRRFPSDMGIAGTAPAASSRDLTVKALLSFDGHLNERGNRVVAEYFADQLDLAGQASGNAAPLH